MGMVKEQGHIVGPVSIDLEKSKVKVMGEVKTQGHIIHPVSS